MFLRSSKIVCKKQIYRYYLFIGSNCQAQLYSPIFGLLQVVYWSVTLRKEFYWLDLLGIQINNCCDARQFANVSTGTLVSTGRKNTRLRRAMNWLVRFLDYNLIEGRTNIYFERRRGCVCVFVCVCVCVCVGGWGQEFQLSGSWNFFSHPKVAQIFLLNIKIGSSL